MQQDLFGLNDPDDANKGKKKTTEYSNYVSEPLSEFVDYRPEFLSHKQQSQLLPYLKDTITWSQPELFVFGKWHLVPRQQAWLGDEGLTYQYSGQTFETPGWDKPMFWLKQKIEFETGFRFNSALLNRYRDGKDKMGWHADDEPELGIDPAVAIVSLGEERDIQFRQGKKGPATSLNLQSGSLLVMSPGMQRQFQHQIPSRKNVQGERFSLTFRYLIT